MKDGLSRDKNFSSDYRHYAHGAVCRANSNVEPRDGRSDVRFLVVEMWAKPSGFTCVRLVRIKCNGRNITELNFLLIMAIILDAVVVEAEVPDVEVVLCSYVSNSKVDVVRARELSISKKWIIIIIL